MTVRFVGDLLVLAVVVGAGYVAGFRVGRQRRPYWSAPPDEDGFRVEVFDDNGMILWQSVHAYETARSIAESWNHPGYAVLISSPGAPVKEIVCGGDLLEEWESVWPLPDSPTR